LFAVAVPLAGAACGSSDGRKVTSGNSPSSTDAVTATPATPPSSTTPAPSTTGAPPSSTPAPKTTTAGPATTAPAKAASASPSGIDGQVVLGPTCPVQREGDPQCGAKPVAAAEVVIRTLGHRDRSAPPAEGPEVARTSSDADGRFRVDLPPGDYTLETTMADGRQCKPLDVTVPSGGRADATVLCDTGIR